MAQGHVKDLLTSSLSALYQIQNSNIAKSNTHNVNKLVRNAQETAVSE